MYLLGCNERRKVLPKHIRIKKVCGSVVGVNQFNIMANIYRNVIIVIQTLHNERHFKTKSLLLITQIDFPV